PPCILPQMNVSGSDSSSRVDYAIKKILEGLLEEIICITERKQNQPEKGMNLDTLKKKRKADEAFEEYEYVYGIARNRF
ncbi:2511_t:CDS:2, partial [Funneliformis geosporum]